MNIPEAATNFYEKHILNRPKTVIFVLLALFCFFSYKTKDFKLDASAETLILEHDEDLRFFRDISRRYKSRDFLVLTYTPKEDLFSSKSLGVLKNLSEDLKKLSWVDSVVTILNVPLLKSPSVSFSELKKDPITLESPKVDLELAKKEFVESPLYRNFIISEDLKSTAIQINYPWNEKFFKLATARNEFFNKEHDGTLTESDKAEMEKVTREYHSYREELRIQFHKNVKEVRSLIKKYNQDGSLFLGGVPMISDDMISFVRKDLLIYGIGMFLFIVIMLRLIFHQLRWIILPLLTCFVSIIFMLGFLSIFGWKVTVISSNFICIQLIVTIALNIYFIVRYTEYSRERPQATNHEIIIETIKSIFVPCLYCETTTIAGFYSLILCDILPIIDFGWMMSIGVAVTFIIVFLILPVSLVLVYNKELPVQGKEFGYSLTHIFEMFVEKHGTAILLIGFSVMAVTIYGITKLDVENSFINYFKKSTDIYKGMKLIDDKLGGTTPLDVLIHFNEVPKTPANAVSSPAGEFSDEFDEFEDSETREEDKEKYWYTSDKIEVIEKVHCYLETLPATGKVLSLNTLTNIVKDLNKGKNLSSFDLALLFKEMPEKLKEIIFSPYVSLENNELRITLRIQDSMKDLKRQQFVEKIRRELPRVIGSDKITFQITGMMVLYNNMLQSLFSSQIKTIGFTLLALFLMFLILFHGSVRLSIIALFPNLLSALTVLGAMGICKIPLDMMTITIVAISIGMAVDNTIQYIYRFTNEFQVDRNYMDTMHRCHKSIGVAMYYTSFIVIVGFSILMTSNFIPTILFGIFANLALCTATLSSLTFLPRLIILIKPFGPEAKK